jgi:plastocyanin
MTPFNVRLSIFALSVAAVAACGGDAKAPSSEPPAATLPAQSNVAPTGHVIEIHMITDEKGNYFLPSKLEAHRGDVLRFVLKSGVHNVHFFADSNAGKTGLPPASDFLQIPGQTWDLTVSLAPGHYYFQCDPHAALGMVARLEVEDDN